MPTFVQRTVVNSVQCLQAGLAKDATRRSAAAGRVVQYDVVLFVVLRIIVVVGRAQQLCGPSEAYETRLDAGPFSERGHTKAAMRTTGDVVRCFSGGVARPLRALARAVVAVRAPAEADAATDDGSWGARSAWSGARSSSGVGGHAVTSS